MKLLNRYSKFIPYFYFLTVIIAWFTYYNKTNGLLAYPILLFAIPFLWQLIKPNKTLNFSLGLSFVCLSSYLIIGYLSNVSILEGFNWSVKAFHLKSTLFVFINFFMSLWIMKHSTTYKR